MSKIKKEKIMGKKIIKPKVKVETKTKKTVAKVRVNKPKPAAKSFKLKLPVKKAKGIIKPRFKSMLKSVIKIAPRVEVRIQVKPVIKPEIKPEAKPEVKPVIKPEIKVQISSEVKPAYKPEVKAQTTSKIKSSVISEASAMTLPDGRQTISPRPKVSPAAEVEPEIEVKVAPEKEIELELPITVKDLAIKLQEKSSVLIKHLMGMGVMIGINQTLDEIVLNKLCLKYNFGIKKAPNAEEVALQEYKRIDKPQELKNRSPIVTFMGHVDHGKTSLLDAIRKTKVTEGEHGGITQHIGAYRVSLAQGEITFLDTPGHEAFTAMRARGARITDIVVLVVAADDGIMPQTQEAIDHARAAGVSIIVAINKIDKAQANLDTVKKQLAAAGLSPEDWGGKTITVPVSAKTGAGIDSLLEMILLQAEIMELKANPDRLAYGVVVEARMAKGKGPVATLLVQNGTLHLNQNIIVGNLYGKIRAMLNDRGQGVTTVGPATPVEILGINGIPQVGEQFFVIEDEKQAKSLIQARVEKEKQQQVKEVKRVNLEELHAQIIAGKIKELNLIVKADVQGSLEAIKDTLDKLNVSEIKINIIHLGAGNINTSDVILAVASNALLLGFNVSADQPAKELISKEGIEVKMYSIIYELANDIKAAVEGMLDPKLKRVFLGRAEVRKMFKLSHSVIIAGCFVTKGKINRNCAITLMRNGAVAFEGKISSLKRFKDDVREVDEGFECGIAVGGFDQLVEGDIIEAYDIEKIARKL